MMNVYENAIRASARSPQYVFERSLDVVSTGNPQSAIGFIRDKYKLRAVCKKSVMTSALSIERGPDNCDPAFYAAFYAVVEALPLRPIPARDIQRVDIVIEERFSPLPGHRSTKKRATITLTDRKDAAQKTSFNAIDCEEFLRRMGDICRMFPDRFTHGEEELLSELEGEVALG